MNKLIKKISALSLTFMLILSASVIAFSAPEVQAAEGGRFSSALANSVLTLVNQERAKVGKNELKFDDRLTGGARIRAKELVDSFSHTRPNGQRSFTAVTEYINNNNLAAANYSASGENIAYGQSTAAEVMNSWMNSAGHRSNILSEKYEYNVIGIAAYLYNGRYYWVQLFGYVPDPNSVSSSESTSDDTSNTSSTSNSGLSRFGSSSIPSTSGSGSSFRSAGTIGGSSFGTSISNSSSTRFGGSSLTTSGFGTRSSFSPAGFGTTFASTSGFSSTRFGGSSLSTSGFGTRSSFSPSSLGTSFGSSLSSSSRSFGSTGFGGSSFSSTGFGGSGYGSTFNRTSFSGSSSSFSGTRGFSGSTSFGTGSFSSNSSISGTRVAVAGVRTSLEDEYISEITKALEAADKVKVGASAEDLAAFEKLAEDYSEQNLANMVLTEDQYKEILKQINDLKEKMDKN